MNHLPGVGGNRVCYTLHQGNPYWAEPSHRYLGRASRRKRIDFPASSITTSPSAPSPFTSTSKVVQTYLVSRSLEPPAAGKPYASSRAWLPKTPNVILGSGGFPQRENYSCDHHRKIPDVRVRTRLRKRRNIQTYTMFPLSRAEKSGEQVGGRGHCCHLRCGDELIYRL